jgi:superfamily II DNA or RNA helicase
MGYEDVKYKGTFRIYQANVLNNIEKYNRDGKIHIVAAPGSGKTILGLELIRHFNGPALILSPSITIRQQWGSRFEESFLNDSEKFSDYFSFDLKYPKLITCITYQALHAALNRLTKPVEDEELDELSIDQNNQVIDFTDFDLAETIKSMNIKTICLDEAHHLRNEWQKSLEAFIRKVEAEATIISLTATPPYDSTIAEWERYISVCGEIDDEISTPQLVAQGTLCPHQDYVYFNYPTESEMSFLSNHKFKIYSCVDEILRSNLFEQLIVSSQILTNFRAMDEVILDYPKGFIALLCIIKAIGRDVPNILVKLVSPSGKLPEFDMTNAETAFDFIIKNPALFTDKLSMELKTVILNHGFIEHNSVNFTTNEKVNRAIISSVGKLESISKIVIAEEAAMGSSLRMLILTDFIKRDLMNVIGTNEHIEKIGTVPIFEILRRNSETGLNISVLSGSLVIVPDKIIDDLKLISAEMGIDCSYSAIGGSDFSEVTFSGSNKYKVTLITEAFQKGLIQVLIGTKSLLGEGWDSPCINSMILASFVGSFMLSNQMRGRAIRIDPKNPNKTANIWHLVTIEPDYLLSQNLIQKTSSFVLRNSNEAEGVDYDLLVRRFKTFYAPAYEEDSIENGIQRITLIKPPFTLGNIESINKKMLLLANDREGLSKKWKGVLKDNSFPEIISVSDVPKKVQPTSFLFINLLNITMLTIISQIIARSFLQISFQSENLLVIVLGMAVIIAILFFLGRILLHIQRFISPSRTIKTLGNCILGALIEMGEIRSPQARFVLNADKSEVNIKCTLVGATTYEKNIFTQAISELLSSIDNPRYLLIKRNFILVFAKKDYSQSYACPSIFSTKREYVDILAEYLKRQSGSFSVQYTRSEEGRRMLLKCRRKSYINRNEIYIKGKKVIKSKWE